MKINELPITVDVDWLIDVDDELKRQTRVIGPVTVTLPVADVEKLLSIITLCVPGMLAILKNRRREIEATNIQEGYNGR